MNKNTILPEIKKEESAPDVVVSTLKNKYFELAAKERYPHTPEITKEIDNLEVAIRELEKKK